MVDVVADLTAQTDATLEAVTRLVTEIQKNVAQLAALQKDVDQRASVSKSAVDEFAAQIGVQIARLKQGSDAALLALRALQSSNPVGAPTAAPAVPAAVVQDSAAAGCGPAAEAPAPVPAAVVAEAPAVADQTSGTGQKV